MILGGIILFIASIIGNLIYTDHELKKKSVISHWHDWKIKAVSGIPAIILFSLAGGNISSLILRLSLPTVMVMVWFWTLFDGIYGVRTASDFFFTGTSIGKNAALSDRIMRIIGKGGQIFLKIGGCVATLWLYIKLL